ncbi:MAG: HEPN domain-containing protein [Nitrospirae bacterium]|nr:HEPN domain-containing protein [Nitrospirota bacterium]
MSAADTPEGLAREWVQVAEDDLRAAAFLLEKHVDCPTGAVCFHAQQSVEKYLKALLVHRAIDFPKTHDLDQITRLVPGDVVVPLSAEERRRLTQYATSARYPGGWEPIPFHEAQGAVEVARRVRDKIQEHLPACALKD